MIFQQFLASFKISFSSLHNPKHNAHLHTYCNVVLYAVEIRINKNIETAAKRSAQSTIDRNTSGLTISIYAAKLHHWIQGVNIVL